MFFTCYFFIDDNEIKQDSLDERWFVERSKYIPIRLSFEERKDLRLVEAALNVSEYDLLSQTVSLNFSLSLKHTLSHRHFNTCTKTQNRIALALTYDLALSLTLSPYLSLPISLTLSLSPYLSLSQVH